MKSTLKIITASFFVFSLFVSTIAVANVQPNFQTSSFVQAELVGGWGDQKERIVTIGAAQGMVQVMVLKDGRFMDEFSFEASKNYRYQAPEAWKGQYDFVIFNEGQETVFTAKF